MHNTYEKLFENNRNWVIEKLNQDPDYFKKMAQGQAPKYLFVGCSDSRVPANEITGTAPGELFVHRNIANVASPSDANFMSVLQYAVEALKVEHIIVCGHYGCGGVAASFQADNYEAHIKGWLGNIQDVYRINKAELDAIDNHDTKLRKLVELNVREQVYQISNTYIVQNALAEGADISVHGWVYDISEGLLRDLEVEKHHELVVAARFAG